MTKYKSYSTYKPSGVEWLGVVPEHWRTWKISHAFGQIGSGTTPDTKNLYFYGGDIPWVTTSELRENTITDTSEKLTEDALREHSALSLYPPGTLLIAMYGATIGRLGILGITACTNQACCALAKPRQLDVKFCFYWLWMRRNEIVLLSSGGGQPNINQQKIYSIRIPAPPLQEQKLIANFLDRETTRIDTLITKKREMIDLLEKKRAAIVTEAVTKGCDRDVPMKDSGISWIGEIPKHWQVRRFKFMINFLEQGWSPACENRLAEEEEWGVLKVGCVNGGYFNELEHKALPGDLDPKLEYEICEGDVLVSRANTKELLGSTAKVQTIQRKLLLCDKLYRLRTANGVDPDFFVTLLQSAPARYQFERDSSGASDSMQNISQASMGNFILPLPPYKEQKSITEKLHRDFQILKVLKEKLLEQLEELYKERQTLITAAVTGKIDVREEIKSDRGVA